jgi:hypothetical protein
VPAYRITIITRDFSGSEEFDAADVDADKT